MSSLAADLSATPVRRQHGPTCSVRLLDDFLTEEERAALVALLADRRISSSAISETLRKHGHEISAGTIVRHRRGRANGGCACESL